jgi:transaldolase
LYVKSLAAPFTVNTMPEATLKALAEHTELGSILPADGGDCAGYMGTGRSKSVDRTSRRMGRSGSHAVNNCP